MENMLLIDSCYESGLELKLSEGSTSKNTKFFGKFQEAEAVNKNKRKYPYDVLFENVQKLKDLIQNRSLIGEVDHPCLQSNDFRVLTVDGWKEFIDIKVGDYVWSRINGKAIRSRVNGIIDKPYVGPIYKVKGKNIDCGFSPDHKFILENRSGKQTETTIQDIYDNRDKYSHCSIPKTAIWETNNNNSENKFIIPGVVGGKTNQSGVEEPMVFETKSFMVLLGLFLSEGYTTKNNGIIITQKTDCGRELIQDILPTIHPELKWSEQTKGEFYTSDVRLKKYLEPLGNCYNKYIPEEIKKLDAKYLEELIYWFLIGNEIQKNESATNHKKLLIETKQHGNLNFSKNSVVNLFSVSKQLIDDLHECLTKTGRCGAKTVSIAKKDYMFAGHEVKACNKRPLYQLRISRAKSIHMDARFMEIREEHHDGRLYCLVTEHGNFYMEHAGKSFWTGNCDSIVHLANASHVVTKLWWEGNILMGEAEILHTPSGLVLKALMDDGVKFGISSRGVGNGKVNEDGILVIGETYKLITFDVVADPSTHSAFQQRVVMKDENHQPDSQKSKIINNNMKNENIAINNINKDLLIAYLGGMVKSRSDEYRMRTR